MTVDIDIISTREVAILRCRGRLVLGDGAAPLRDAARRALSKGQVVALDLGPVTQMDAHGTGVLAELADIARREGRALVVARVSDRVRRLMRVTRLDTVVPGLREAASSRRDVPIPCRAIATARA